MKNVAKLQAVLSTRDGTKNGRQQRVTCPDCETHSLDLALGTGRFIAHCLNPKCKETPGSDLLKLLGLTVRTLPESEFDFMSKEVFGGDLSEGVEVPRASPEIRHSVYTELLARLKLDDTGRKFLRGYALTDDAILYRQYRSWPDKNFASDLPHSIAERLAVPGVIKLSSGLDLALRHERFAGVLIPCRNAKGQILALKVRLYKPDATGKMRTLSSDGYKGPTGEYCVHVPLGVKTSETFTVVEGELKADVVASLKKIAVVGAPGVQGL